MAQPMILFRCQICEEETNVPLEELCHIPICPIHQQLMKPVGDLSDVNDALDEVMKGLCRLAAAALRNNGIAAIDKRER